MTIKGVLVGLASAEEVDPGRDYAISLASAFGASLTGVAYAIEPVVPGVVVTSIPADIRANYRAQIMDEARSIAERCSTAARTAGVPFTPEVKTVRLQQATAAFSALARTFDVAVLTRHDPEHGLSGVGEAFMEAVLFDSGQPLILVPYGQPARFRASKVLIAWDGSATAARAVTGAMPILCMADTVEVATVGKEADAGIGTLAPYLLQHLARHGVNATAQTLTGSFDAGQSLLERAGTIGADLVVMGAYRHSRLRQALIGGVTQTVLDAMKLPVLLAH